MNKEKMNQEQRLLHLTVAAGILFSVIEVMMAIYTNSQAVLMDSIYDGAEAVVLALMVFLVPLLYRPYSERKPYGYAQLESFFLLGKGGFLAAVTIGLIVGNIQMIVNGGNHVNQGLIGWFELFLAGLSAVILIALLIMNRRVDSPLIQAELLGWKIDVCSSIGVAAAFLCASFLSDTPFAWLSPYVDQIIAIVIAMIMLPQPWRMMKDAFRSLILFAPEEAVTQRIRKLADHEFERYSYEPTFYNIIQTGRKLWVEIYIRNDTNMINVAQLAAIQKQLSSSLQDIYDDVYVEITPDIKEAAGGV
jgi:cation diffusion facilitator family transporter